AGARKGGGKRRHAEQREKGTMADVQPAGIGAECRHHHALTIGSEAAPRHAAAALRNPGGWMQMAGNLAVSVLQRRLVTEDQASDRKLGGDAAANSLRRVGVVITGEPEPLGTPLQ